MLVFKKLSLYKTNTNKCSNTSCKGIFISKYKVFEKLENFYFTIFELLII